MESLSLFLTQTKLIEVLNVLFHKLLMPVRVLLDVVLSFLFNSFDSDRNCLFSLDILTGRLGHSIDSYVVGRRLGIARLGLDLSGAGTWGSNLTGEANQGPQVNQRSQFLAIASFEYPPRPVCYQTFEPLQ